MAATLALTIGGYLSAFHARTAGPFGCDPCLACGQRPAAGARVWMNCYGDLRCDPCAGRLARAGA